MYAAFERDREHVPDDAIVDLRYEDITQDPVGEIERAYSTLKLGEFENVRSKLVEMTAASKDYRTNKYSPSSEQTEFINSAFATYIEKYGYAEAQATT